MRLAQAARPNQNCLVLEFTIVSSVPAPAGVISWWPGGKTNDVIGANHVSFSSGATNSAGEVGQGFSLDGVNDRITAPDSATLDFGAGQDFSLEAWINPQDSGNDYGVATFVATNHLRDGSYHHVAATLDRSSTNGGKIYVDGIPVLTFNPTVLSGPLSNNAPVRIGVHPQPGFNGWYKGIIAEASIYRRALSGTEITALYAAGSAGKCKTDADGDGLTD
jgi:hypothetical protein